MEEQSEYDKQAEKFLKDTQTEFKSEFIENGLYFEDIEEKDKRDIYLITLKRGTREFKFKYGNSINASTKWFLYTSNGVIKTNNDKEAKKIRDRKLNIDFKEPSVYDVLACLTKYAPEDFKDFCAEYGYNEDSRKAEKIYKDVLNEYQNLKMLYTDKELEALQDIS